MEDALRPPKKRRLSSGGACTSCRKGKNRCDGQRPECGTCVSRGKHCSYPSKLVSQLSIEELKLYMNQKLQAVAEEEERSTPQRAPSPTSRTAASQRTPAPGLDALIQVSNLARDPPSTSPAAITSVGPAAHTSPLSVTHSIEQLSPARPRSDRTQEDQRNQPEFAPSARSPETEGYFGPSSTFNFVAKVLPEGSSHSGDVQDYNSQRRDPATIEEPTFAYEQSILGTVDDQRTNAHDLPDQSLADSLVDAYFNCVHRLYPFVHESTFRNQYERLWRPSAAPPIAKFKPEWLAILNMAFANGCEFCDTIDREQVLPMASVFVSRARALLSPRLFLPGCLERVQAMLLMCHYLQGTLELCECWNLVGVMVRTAISIGLHLPVTDEQCRDAVQKEMVKRVWCGCYIIDRTLSMKFGRPPSIQVLNVHDIPLPLEVDDMYITPETLVPRQPVGRPSLTRFFLQTVKLTEIVDQVLKELYNPSLRTNSTLELDPAIRAANQNRVLGATASVDARLLSWWSAVPKNLREEPELSDGVDFQRQRNVIYIRFLNLRTLLHRQALLIYSQQEIEDPFQRGIAIASSKACVLASKQTIRIIHSQYHRQLLNSITYNLHYVFTAMGVLLTLETMDEVRLRALDEASYREALDLGMEFLLAASNLSRLASRYVAMLQKLRNSGHVLSKPFQGPGDGGNGPVPNQNSVLSSIPDKLNPKPNVPVPGTSESISPPWVNQQPQAHGQGSSGLDINSQQGIEMGLLDIDFNDFLYGTGLPRDFIMGQWPGIE